METTTTETETITIKKGHRYIFQEVSFTPNYPHLRELLILEISNEHYKVKNMIGDAIFWINQAEIQDTAWGIKGYCPVEDLGLYKTTKSKKV